MWVKSIIATVLLGLAACSSSPAEDPGGLLVTRSDGSVAIIDTDGIESARLNEGASITRPIQATASPLGDVIWVDQTARGRVLLWSGGETRTLAVPFEPFYFSWDPLGERVVLLGNGTSGVAGAILVVSDGSLVDLGEATPFFFDWRPSGTGLVGHLDRDTTVLIDAKTGTRRLISDSDAGFGAPEFLSEDVIITVRGSAGVSASIGLPLAQADENQLVVTDLASSTSTVVETVEPFTAFSSTTDGRIAFVTGDAADGILADRLSVVKTSEPADPVVVFEDSVVALEWSPTGSHLLFFTIDLDAAELTPHVWDGEGVTSFPPYRPTDLYISQYLPFADQYARSQTAWSPDGSAFAYVKASGEDGEVWIQSLDGRAEELGPGIGVSWIP
jgi:hypothetical protein